MSLVIYECSHFPTVLPTFDMSIPFFVLIYSYKMVHDDLTLHLRGLDWLICISLITDLFYILVYYLYFLLCIVYVLCSSRSFMVTQEPHGLTTYSTPEPRVQVAHQQP